MAVTAERFAQGLTYDGYKDQMTRNKERFEENERTLEIDPSALAIFKMLPDTLNVLVLAEDWCGDVIANLPVLGRLAEESGKLNLRVFLRDQNLDLMDQYLKEGQFRSIPVFVFFDNDFNELGYFIERPDSVTATMARKRDELYAQHPEFGDPNTPPAQMPEDVRVQVMAAMNTLREQNRPFANNEVVRAVRAIVETPSMA